MEKKYTSKRNWALLFSFGFTFAAWTQVNYVIQTGNFTQNARTVNTNANYFAGSYNNGGAEVGFYANGSGGGYTGDPGVASFQTFTTNGIGSGTARPLQVGDQFVITCYVGNSSSFFNNSNAGISFNGGTASGSFADFSNLQRAKFQINRNGNWFSAASTNGAGFGTPGADRTFTLKVTSTTTVNLTISGSNGATGFNLSMANSPDQSGSNIRSFAIWNQSSGGSNDMYWKNGSVTSTGTVELDQASGSATISGNITNGLEANSTSTVKVNSLIKTGGGTIVLTGDNTYTGNTDVEGGTLQLSGSGKIGTNSAVRISSGAVLNLNGVNTTVGSISERGSGNGGTINLGSATLTVSGGWSGTRYQNGISGTGGLIKQGTGVLDLYGTQSFTGPLSVQGGTVISASNLASSLVTVENGATFSLRPSDNISLSSLTIKSGGTLNIPAGRTLTINGTLTIEPGANITINSTGIIAYGTNGKLLISNGTNYTLNDTVFPSTNGPKDFEINVSGTVDLHSSKSLSGDLTLTSGTLNLGNFTLNRASSGGVLTMLASTTLIIGSTNSLPTNYASHAFNASSTVNYNGTNQTVATLSGSAQYGNIILSGSGNKVLGGNVAVANDLTVQTGVALTVASGQNLTVTDQLINSGGTVTLQNNANLIQGGTTNTNSGAITVNRDSFSLKRLDYTLWSAPVAAQNLLAFSPLTMANRFYTYNPSSNQYNAITPSSNNFATGVGYLIRMPDNHPTSPTVWTGQFSGVPNNGDVTISVTNNTYNAVGNPYPSTIDADDFINDNNLTEALYFWRKTNGDPGSAYATYTLAGGAGTGPSDSNAQVPNGIIQVGQGFIARSTSTSLVFNNGMRVANNANQFFRSASETEQNRIRVQTTGPNGFYGEVLVNYMTGATNGIDAALDGKYINDSEDALFTIVETEPYVIQARALPFDVSDVVPLGFKTTQNGTFTFDMTQNDGLFESDYQVFLNDKLLNVVHPFAEGAYSFVSNAGTFNERFELIFEEGALSVNHPKATKEDVIVFQQNGNWQIQSLNTPLQSIEIVEVTGKQLLFKTGLTQTQESIFLTVNAPQLLLVKIGLQNGQTLFKKIVIN